jgi:hypothetical protein
VSTTRRPAQQVQRCAVWRQPLFENLAGGDAPLLRSFFRPVTRDACLTPFR